MTGFGKAYYKDENLKLVVLIRSVNGKGLDISTRLPKELIIYEKEIRETIKKLVHRGNIFLSIQLEFFKIKPSVRIGDLGDIVDDILMATRRLGLNISDDLTLQLAMKFYNPNMSEENYVESNEFKELFFGVLDKALADFIKSKIEEGKNLLNDIENQLQVLENLLGKVEAVAPTVINRQKEKLLEKAKEFLKVEDNPLVAAELKLLLEKLDINEEIQRLKSHIEVFKRELQKGAPVGKKLEFITQEMLREVNTMGNKLPDLFPIHVEMKTAIDKIKQQVANIE